MIHTVVIEPEELAGAEVPTVVFLHGLFGQGRNFTTAAKGLLPAARSVLVDLPDHGRSDWTEAVDMIAMADEIAAALREQSPFHLVGHSLGGKVAMVLAVRHPDLIDRLVVVDIAPAASHSVTQFEELLGALATIDLPTLPNRAAADAALREFIPDDGVRAFLLQNLHRNDAGWRWRANLDLLRSSLDTIGGFPDFGEARYEGQVLWVTGERSHYVTEADEQAMRALFPRTVHASIKGAGHWVHSEKPDAFLATLRHVLLGV